MGKPRWCIQGGIQSGHSFRMKHPFPIREPSPKLRVPLPLICRTHLAGTYGSWEEKAIFTSPAYPVGCGILELWLVAPHALWPFPGLWGLTVCSCQEDRFLFSLIPFSDTSLAISKEYRENGSTLKGTAIFSIVSIFGVLMLFSHCPICCWDIPPSFSPHPFLFR